MKVVIVGGVAGGASAAARLRRLDEQAQITIYERSGYISYANCGLPYYIGGTIQKQAELTLQTPASFKKRFNIEVKVGHEVQAIDRAKKQVTVCDLASGQLFQADYDKLILAPGAQPVRPPLPGVDSPRLYTLRTVEDTLRIREIAASGQVKTAVVIGGGFIGVEMAENLRELGLAVSLIQRENHLLAPLDQDLASFLHAHMREKGVKLLLEQSVTGFAETETGLSVQLAGSEPVSADMAILAIGVQPESTLAKAAGLELGPKDSVAVNEQMQTSDPDIYAVGDAVAIRNTVTGQPALIALAGPANKQGRVAADNIAGLESRYTGSPGSSLLKIFEMTAAFCGLNEQAAQAAGLAYEKLIISPASHAAYYPGGRQMTIKLLFDKQTEKILGAQSVGFDGVDKRLDVIATAMQAGLGVRALKELDLAYAPPYSSAKDPVNMLGFVAENVITGKVKHFFYEDIANLPKDGSVTLLDVRPQAEYRRGHAADFKLNLPLDSLRERLAELPSGKPVYVMCQTGIRSYIACRILQQNGFDCFNFAGGYRFYASVHDDQFDADCRTDCGL